MENGRAAKWQRYREVGIVYRRGCGAVWRLFARKGAVVFLGFFGLAKFEVGLADAGGFGGIHAGFEFGFFEEVAPAFVTVGRTLGLFESFTASSAFCLPRTTPMTPAE